MDNEYSQDCEAISYYSFMLNPVHTGIYPNKYIYAYQNDKI